MNKWLSKPFYLSRLIQGHLIADGIAGYWLVNEATGNKIYDLSGYGNTGTIVGADWVPGPTLDFNGSADHVNINSSLESTTERETKTIAAWVNSGKANYTARGRIISLARTTTSTAFMITALNTTNTWEGTYITGGSSFATLNSGISITTDDWTHILLVQDGTSIKLYINGVEKASANNASAPTITSPANAFIGAYNFNGEAQQFFDGLIDNVMILNRALSEREILSLYADEYQLIEHSFKPWMHGVSNGGIPILMHHYTKNIG